MTTTALTDSTTETTREARQWAMFLHLSGLLGYVAPLLGFIAPFAIWQVKKDQLPWLDDHGKNAGNWILSSLLYLVICVPLCFVLVGVPLMFALAVLNVLFPVIAGIKATNGETWRYPLSIRFFT